jgi:Protein of unknown function (DUF2752)
MTYEWRHLRAQEIDHERLWLCVAIACVTLLALGQVSSQFEFAVPQCTLKLLTGIPCPTCGGTRALRALFGHGAVLAALRFNPLVTIAALAAVPFLIYAAAVSIFRWPRMRVFFAGPEFQLLRHTAWIAILANWIFLIADGR